MVFRRTKIRGTALVTGASAGIGAEFAKVFAAHKHDVILVARRQDALEAVAGQVEGAYGVRAMVLPLDLTDADAPAELFARILDARVEVDILVNNAGAGLVGEFVETDMERELQMIQLNVAALTHLTKLFVRPMVQRRSGGVLNVASTAAFFPGPLNSVYHASKAYVLSFTEAIAEELRGSGVSVTVLCPGPTISEFHEVAGARPISVLGAAAADAREVAEFGYDALQSGVRVAVPGVQNKLIAQARRLAPRGVATRVVRMLQQRRLRV